jgi:hypothetical protein
MVSVIIRWRISVLPALFADVSASIIVHDTR